MADEAAGPVERHLEVTRTARYYTLGDAASARECWVVCHGFSQLAGKFATYFADVAEVGRVIVAPEALNRYYLEAEIKPHGPGSPVGATWMTREDREAEIADYVGYLDRLRAAVAPDLAAVALGFSQGGATAARWVARGARAAGTLVLWGSTLPHDLTAADADRIGRGRLIYVRGTTDRALPAAAIDADRDRLEEWGVSLEPEVVEYDGGHRIDREGLKRLAERLAG